MRIEDEDEEDGRDGRDGSGKCGKWEVWEAEADGEGRREKGGTKTSPIQKVQNN